MIRAVGEDLAMGLAQAAMADRARGAVRVKMLAAARGEAAQALVVHSVRVPRVKGDQAPER